MKIKKPRQTLIKNQSGIASIVIVMLIMTLLTVVVLAMTQNANREQRQALDRQLSTQAFYAAESGVSDAKDYIADPPAGTPPPIEKDECQGIGSAAASGDQFPDKDSQVGEFENTRYTCVLYDRTPNELRFTSIDVSKSTIVPIEDAGGQPIRSLTFNWTKKDGGTDFSCPTGNTLPKQLPDNCQAGLLRVELVDPASSTRAQLINNTFLAYVKPSPSGSSSFTYDNAVGSVNKQGAIVEAGCTAAGGCTMTITSIAKDKLYLNMRSIYKNNQVFITGERADGGPVRFRDAQMEVDSTGQAGDILKRVLRAIDLSGLDSEFIPSFVLQTSTDLCKRLEIRLGSVTDECPAP